MRLEPHEAGGRTVPWRLLLGGGDPDALAAAGPWNMAVDDALLASAAAGGPPTLRFYRWNPACVSVGRNQPIRGLIAPGETERRGWQLVRRPTGGLAVLHAREITYSVVAGMDVLGRPRAAYLAISAALAEGLRDLGVDANVASPAAHAPLGRGPGYLSTGEPSCFADAAPGEVTASGRKILGSAQRRAGGTLLQHGSLLLAGSQDPVGGLLGSGGAGAAPPPAAGRGSATTVRAELDRLPADARIVEALAGAFARRIARALSSGGLSAGELALAEERAVTYSSEAWTWRR